MVNAFTAKLEEELDKVAEGDVNWKKLLNGFIATLRLNSKKKPSGENGIRRNQPVEIGVPCHLCSRPMHGTYCQHRRLLGCSGYALPPKERCKGHD